MGDKMTEFLEIGTEVDNPDNMFFAVPAKDAEVIEKSMSGNKISVNTFKRKHLKWMVVELAAMLSEDEANDALDEAYSRREEMVDEKTT